MTDPLASLDATAQAELVRRRELSPLELVDAAIARIEALNGRLNAVIHPLFERARAAAAAAELPDGPFRGVPLLVKDAVCQTAGDPYHLGARFLKRAGWRSDHDSELARRFRACGFVLVGKTNTPEFALSVTTEPLAYGATRNPWNPDHSPGGSSGGSAAAVAAGLVPAAHGNDMGGSIRMPASCCGLVGLKPSRHRNSLAPDFGEYWGPLTHEHVLTRSLRDSAAVLDATAGPAAGDPYAAPPPARPWREEVGAPPGRLRVGFRASPRSGRDSEPECAEAVHAVARLLESLGHHVEEASPEALGASGMGPGFGHLMAVAIAREVDRWSQSLGREVALEELEPFNAAIARQGRELSGRDYVAALEGVHAYARRMAAWWQDGWDVLLTPTAPALAPKLGFVDPLRPIEELGARMARYTTFTAPFNLTGQPAVSLPLHWSADGLPVGVQLVAADRREDVLFRLASQLEQARPWRERRPPLHA